MANSFTIKAGATNAPTGGTDQTFSEDGRRLKDGYHYIDAAEGDFLVRNECTLKDRQPSYDVASGDYSKAKRSFTIVRPSVSSAGNRFFNLLRIEIEVHPEFTTAEITALLNDGVQLGYDAELQNFWQMGTKP